MISGLCAFEIIALILYKANPFSLIQTKPIVKLDYGDVVRKGGLGPGGYLKENIGDFVVDGYGNPVWWETNSRGFRNAYEVSPLAMKGTFRILSIGDSFVAGYRVGQEDSFSRLLENNLNNKSTGIKYEVLIAEIEEPTTGLYYLLNFGIRFNPDFVLLGITLGNDIAQSFIGLDHDGTYILDDKAPRIVKNPNNTLGFAHGLETKIIPTTCFSFVPAEQGRNNDEASNLLKRLTSYRLIEGFFGKYEGASIISWYGDKSVPRLFDACNGLGAYLSDPTPDIKESYIRLFGILKAFNRVSIQNDFTFAVVIFPQRFQVQEEDWIATKKDYHLHTGCFDLMKPNKMILKYCNENGITCIDPTLQMKKYYKRVGRSLYLPNGDMHWNVLGHKALYESIKDNIHELIRSEAGSASEKDIL